jgi:hypothetical protein
MTTAQGTAPAAPAAKQRQETTRLYSYTSSLYFSLLWLDGFWGVGEGNVQCDADVSALTEERARAFHHDDAWSRGRCRCWCVGEIAACMNNPGCLVAVYGASRRG